MTENQSSAIDVTKLRKTSIGRKMGFALLLAVLFLFSILLVITSLVIKTQTTESYYEIAHEIVNGRADEINKWIEVYKNDLKVYSDADVVKSGDPEAVIEWLHNHQNLRNPDYDYMFFCDAEGTSYRDTGLVGGKGALVERDYYKAMMNQGKDIFVGNVVLSKTSGQYVMPIARAAKDANGRTFGFFVGMLGINQIKNEVEGFQIGETGYFLLTDINGQIVAHRNPDYVLQQIEVIPEVAKLVYSGNGKNSYAELTLDGANCVSFVAPVADTGYSIGYIVSLAQVHTATTKTQKVVIIVGIIVALVLSIFFFFALSRVLARLKKINKLIRDLSSGDADLTVRLNVRNADEIGELVIGVNMFLEKFHQIMTNIKQSELELNEAGQVLAGEIENTTSTIAQMSGNIGLVNDQVSNQSSVVGNTTNSISEISKNIESLDSMIQGQSSTVVEASAAIEEMIGNINSVDKSVIKMVEEFTMLELDTKNGIEQNSSVNGLIQKISEQSVSMVDANTTIQSIAEQTNLLAMNAAIEAAHAGEAGKGFSVVADEIRKLAETSAEQSGKIGEELSKIQGGIEQVVNASSESEKSFQSVSTRINLTSELITQIRGAMEEQQSGSQQILEALQAMNDSTSKVRDAGNEMTQGGDSIKGDVTELRTSMDNISTAVSDINEGTRYVNESTQNLREISTKLRDAIKKISDDVDLFKV
ncbi:MAG: methyl-accepting chemotaxis protein [Treponema sp.]|nr:methyl-accepting chemotaxis protein [Treponema sp.]